MKPAILLAIVIVILSSLPLVSHRSDAEAQESIAVRQSLLQPRDAASMNTQIDSIKAALIRRLDPNSAKTGDIVTTTVTDKLRMANGMEIPKGSRLIGRITNIDRFAGAADFQVNIAFDRVELASGQSIPIPLDSGSRLAPRAATATAK